LATTSVGTGATRVAGRGKFLIPGLIDTHVHLGANANKDGLSTLGVLLSHGVTGIRDAGSSAQDGWLVTLRQRAEKGEVLSPRLHVSGMISGRALTRARLDAPAYAQQLVDRGVDGLRIRDGLTPDDIRAIMSVAITAGTDCLPVCGAGLQDELSLLVGAGLSPAAALRAATSDAARVLGWSERTGRIAPRLDADLVLLDGDPLRDIEQTRRVHAVVVKGRYLDRQALDALSSSAASGRHPTTRQTSAQSGSTRP
jgi:imidazolonepropionase-like amidohydrolase